MLLHIRVILVIVLLGLTACGAPPQEAISSDAPTNIPATATTAPAGTPSVTAVPTATIDSATLVPATATPSATSATATADVTATAVPSATATDAATATAAPSATVLPSTPQTPATSTPTSTSPVSSAGGSVRSGTIAFVREGSIYAYRPQTDAVTLLIEDGRDVQFSRDGTQLAFVRDDGLYLAAADGSAVRQIVAQTEIAAPRWADDGSKLLFERGRYGAAPGYSEIWTIELPQSTAIKIAEGNDPAWAPDSKRIAYVTPNPETTTYGRNELHLTNWRGQNDWPVVRQVPANTPAVGIPGSEIPAQQLEHLLFAPVWNSNGSAIYMLARATMQVETDFILFESADPINGGATYLDTLIDTREAVASPDRRGVVFTTSSARGDISLSARPLDSVVEENAYDALSTGSPQQMIYQYLAQAWSPDSSALASIRCADNATGTPTCDLVLLATDQAEPEVLSEDVLLGQPLDYTALPTLSWGQ